MLGISKTSFFEFIFVLSKIFWSVSRGIWSCGKKSILANSFPCAQIHIQGLTHFLSVNCEGCRI